MILNSARSVARWTLIISGLCIAVSGQTVNLHDEFTRIPCGDFMARMDAIYLRTKDRPDLRVYVVYFGGRFRRLSTTKNGIEITQLAYPHKEDGLNWAKSIPLYLSSYRYYDKNFRESAKDRLFLIDGGYGEEDRIEIWIGTEPPSPRASPIDPQAIRFRDDKPRSVPDFTRCYEDY